MTREGYLKHHDKDYFAHWLQGNHVYWFDKLINKWIKTDTPIFDEKTEYCIEPPKNKWEGTQVYEHWQNGGEVEYYSYYKQEWLLLDDTSWANEYEYRVPLGHWIRTKPPKDRRILREDKNGTTISTKYKPLQNIWELYDRHATEGYFTPNKWAEIPKE